MALVGPILGALYLIVECMYVSESASISMPGDSILFKVQTFFSFSFKIQYGIFASQKPLNKKITKILSSRVKKLFHLKIFVKEFLWNLRFGSKIQGFSSFILNFLKFKLNDGTPIQCLCMCFSLLIF